MTVIEYVTEEVRRQGHNVAARDGIERVGWMLDAWSYALRQVQRGNRAFRLDDVVLLGKIVEPQKNRFGFRRVGVWVGTEPTPNPEEIPHRMKRLFQFVESTSPLEFYKEFEMIHPFVDGNGRTGKVLLNWLNGSLLAPVFPPADLFGEPILNP